MQEENFLNVLKSRMVDGIIYVSSDYATSNKLLADLYQAMKEVAEYISKKGCNGSD